MKRSVKILWFTFWGGLILVIGLFLCANFGVFGKMPSISELENPEADVASEVYSADGILMGKYYLENRSEVSYDEISPNIIQALIATEDQNFYDHSGIDAKAVARAILKLGTDGGGSPITQQLAKMMLGQGQGNFLKRGLQKIKEWIIAVKLERNFTKEEIITLYLNRAPWGNAYGIKNAAKIYFQKEPKNLKLEEAAVLVGMLKGFIYNPIGHPKASLDRRNTVIERMVDCKQHYLSEDAASKVKAKPLITNFKKIDENIGIAPYFRDALKEKLKVWCAEHKNPKTGEPYNIYRSGLKIYTSINSKMQQYAEEAIVQHMPSIQKKLDWIMKNNGTRIWKGHEVTIEAAMKFTERWKNLHEDGMKDEDIKKTFFTPVKMKVFAWNAKREKDTTLTPYDSIKYHKQLLQTSFAAMDPKTGEVKCWVGGIDYKWFKFDHITTKRQVGSTIKPLIYSLAVQDAGYTPETNIDGGTAKYGTQTYTGGGGSMANCLAYSKNIASIRITNMVGVKRVLEFADICGIKSKIPAFASVALGAAEIPMLEMLQAYTMFPNNSYNISPILMTRIEDKSGNVLQQFVPENKQVMSEASAYTMVQLMKGVVKFGTAKNLNNYNIPVEKAGKTGTTNSNSDGWFIGYTPELLAGTWVGCEDPFIRIYAGTSGGNEMAAPSWGFFMGKVYADKKLNYGKIKTFAKPVQFDNDPIYADDVSFSRIVNRGDTVKADEGNPDASEYMDVPIDNSSNEKDELIPIESNIPSKPTIDTSSKPKPTGGNKPDDKKDVKVSPAIIKPVDDKGKKKVEEKVKNEY
jgi:penicillin-binding protein 1A